MLGPDGLLGYRLWQALGWHAEPREPPRESLWTLY